MAVQSRRRTRAPRYLHLHLHAWHGCLTVAVVLPMLRCAAMSSGPHRDERAELRRSKLGCRVRVEWRAVRYDAPQKGLRDAGERKSGMRVKLAGGQESS